MERRTLPNRRTDKMLCYIYNDRRSGIVDRRSNSKEHIKQNIASLQWAIVKQLSNYKRKHG